MTSYLLTLLGIIMLGVLIDIILPSGSTSKYISGIFAILVLFVMVSPVVNWIKGDYNLKDYFTSSDILINEKLLTSINNYKFNTLEADIEQELEDKGYNNVGIDIKFIQNADNVEITQVLVDLTNLVINQDCENINKYVYIRQVVQSKVAVTKEVIMFCE